MLEQVSLLPGHSEEVFLHRKRGLSLTSLICNLQKNDPWLKALKQVGLVHAQKSSIQHYPHIQLLHLQGGKKQGKICRERRFSPNEGPGWWYSVLDLWHL